MGLPRIFAERREVLRFALFLVVGLANTIVGYSIFALFITTSARPTLAAVGATVLGALFNFRSIGAVVFRSRDNGLLPRFLFVYCFQCAANIAALRVLAAVGVAPLPAEAVTLPLLAIATFLLMRRFIFGHAAADRLCP